jgi:benzoate membrane transport protein
VSGLFERVMDRIPQALAAALLAGVLTRFAFDAFLAVRSADAAGAADGRWPTWPAGAGGRGTRCRACWPSGAAVAALHGQLHLEGVAWRFTTPVFTMPAFSLAALVGVALPLFVVTMASQNLPGVAAQRAAGYAVPVSPPIAATGLASLLLAPFGGYALNLAAITAAICMGREATRTRRGATPRR